MNWLLAAHRSELANKGDYVLLSGGSEQIAVLNLDGQIIACDNVCPHRGAKVFSGPCGSQHPVCPYHGRRGEAAIGTRYLTAWLNDWIFVGDGSTRLETELGDILPLVAGISDKIGRRHSFDVTPMPCDWRVAVENALEDDHIPMVHPDTFGKLKLELGEMERHGNHSVAKYAIGDSRTVAALGRFAKHFRDVDPASYFHIFIYPGTCISSVGGFSYSVQHYLSNGGFTSFHTRLYQPKLAADAPNYDWFFNEATQFNRQVFEQDSAICARVVGEGTILTENERRVLWFREANVQSGAAPRS